MSISSFPNDRLFGIQTKKLEFSMSDWWSTICYDNFGNFVWTLKNQQTVNKQINLLRHVLLKKFSLPYEFQNYLERRKSRKPMETLAMRSSFTLCWEPSCNTNWDQSGKNQLGSSSVTDAAALKTSGARERTQAPLHSSRSLWQQNLK